jgi:histidinol-phosphate aminotransferase
VIPVRPAVAAIHPYVPGKRVAGAVKLSSNENPLGVSTLARAAARDSLSEASIYPDGGARTLRRDLARFHGIDADRFIVGNGSDEVMILSAATFLEPGSKTLMGANTFSQYEFATQLFGGDAVTVSMPDGRYPLDAIVSAVDPQTRIIFLCNPNNPTGRYFTHDQLVNLLERVPESVLVVEDEAYREYVEASDFPRSVELQSEYGNLLVLRTFSKIYGMAGLRVGYGVGTPTLVEDLNRTKQPFNVGSVSQAAAGGALRDTSFVARSVELNQVGKRYLYRELRRLCLEFYPTEANFICIEIGRDSEAAAAELTAMGVTVRPLSSFGLSTKIRVTVGTSQQNELFIRCLETLLAGGN